MERLGPYTLNSVIVGDSMELCEQIPDESVHLIMCDPVWWELDQYRWLGQLAARVLVPGGNVVAQAGTDYRRRCENLMLEADGMVERPLLTERFTGGFAQMWKHRSLNTYHPYIWMSKGEEVARDRWVHDGVRGAPDKTKHMWGDGAKAFIMWMSAMTKEGDVVLDPFAGGGTVAVAAKTLGRRWLAFEIDEEQAMSAMKNIRNAPDPLLIAEADLVQPNLI